MFSGFTHNVAYFSTSVLFKDECYSIVWIYRTLSRHQLKHFGCSHFLPKMMGIMMLQTFMYPFVEICVQFSWARIPRGRIAGSRGNSKMKGCWSAVSRGNNGAFLGDRVCNIQAYGFMFTGLPPSSFLRSIKGVKRSLVWL